MELLQKHVIPVFIQASAHDMTGQGHAADIHLYLQSPVGKMMKILVEAKQYTRTVKTKEVCKLQNDVDGDDEALAGIMISNSSQIASVKQFQIEKTTKGKYILYLSLEGYDDEYRGLFVCWAIRVLSTLATYSADTSDDLVSQVTEFFTELEKSVQDADIVVKNCQKATDSAIIMKRNILRKLEDFKRDNLKSHGFMVYEEVIKEPSEVSEEFIVEIADEEKSAIKTPLTMTKKQKYYAENRERLLEKAREARLRKKDSGRR
jgi:hypothetical protein